MSPEEATRTIGYLLEARPTTMACARNAEGERVPPSCPEACCWCLVGGVLLLVERCAMELEGLVESVAAQAGVCAPHLAALAIKWDGATETQRRRIVERLKATPREECVAS